MKKFRQSENLRSNHGESIGAVTREFQNTKLLELIGPKGLAEIIQTFLGSLEHAIQVVFVAGMIVDLEIHAAPLIVLHSVAPGTKGEEIVDGEGKKIGLSTLIDKAIHDTMSRSLLTSSTVFIVLLALFFFGPESLKGFTLALLFGTIVGTYSSICIASPLLIDITKGKTK